MMPHWLRALLVFVAIPVGALLVLAVSAAVAIWSPSRKSTVFDVWLGGVIVALLLAVVAWALTE